MEVFNFCNNNPPTKTIVHQGWLAKRSVSTGCANQCQVNRPWTKRWFTLKSGSRPNQYLLEYLNKPSTANSKQILNLEECCAIYHKSGVKYRKNGFSFRIKTDENDFHLRARNLLEFEEWIHVLCRLCNFEMTDWDEYWTVYSSPDPITPARSPKRVEINCLEFIT